MNEKEKNERNHQLAKKANWVRQKVVEMAVHAKSGHISSAFSEAELLVSLYHGKILRYDAQNPEWPERDRFIMSKGQGAIGLFPVLADVGFFPKEELDNFAGKGSRLGVHLEWSVPGVEVTTGSLGHGLPIATGVAQAAINDNKDFLVFCLLGDAELFEGSNWEAATFAAHQGYNNLICIVDRNQQGVLGFTDEIKSRRDGPRLDPIDEKFCAFGFETRVIDGHDYDQIFDAFKDIRNRDSNKPLVIIANTTKGKDASIMENKRLWHYRVPTDQDLELTRSDLKKKGEELWQVQNS